MTMDNVGAHATSIWEQLIKDGTLTREETEAYQAVDRLLDFLLDAHSKEIEHDYGH